jgi:hypothetical protein
VALSAKGLALTLILPLVACGGPRTPEEPLETERVEVRLMHGSPADLTGTWAQLVVTTSVSSAPLVGEVTTENRRLFVLEFSQSGESILAESQLCDMTAETSTSMASTVVPRAFIDAIGHQTWEATLSAGVFESPETARSLGLGDLAPDAALPTDPADPLVIDADGDGHPGVTIEVTGLAGGEMYFVQRGWRRLTSASVDGTRIDGVIEWGDERVVLDATSRSLRNARPSVPTEDPRENYFYMVRVVEGAACASLVEAGSSLFAR